MKTSEKDIAFRHSVSHATVNSLLQQLYQDFKVQRNFLPPHLCFDEFRSVKGVDASMSFLFLNAESGQILNILPDRRMPALIRYFMSYSRKAREAVKTDVYGYVFPLLLCRSPLFPSRQDHFLTASTSFSCSAALSIRPASIS